jgi:hypothetical protein
MIVPRGYGIPATRIISRGYGGAISTITSEWVGIGISFDRFADTTPFFSHLCAPIIITEHIATAEWAFGHPGEIEITPSTLGNIVCDTVHIGITNMTLGHPGLVEIIVD